MFEPFCLTFTQEWAVYQTKAGTYA